MPTLKSQLDELARSFAEQIVAALRSASLDELVSSGGAAGGNGRAPRAPLAKTPAATSARAPKAARSSGRLNRRSAEEIAAVLNKIVLLVKTQKDGLRAEQIRSKLGMQAKEMPRILKEGIAAKKLTTKGQKRATTYFAK
jgi:hypothetical protein